MSVKIKAAPVAKKEKVRTLTSVKLVVMRGVFSGEYSPEKKKFFGFITWASQAPVRYEAALLPQA